MTTPNDNQLRRARGINLLVPGAGLILIGGVLSGTLIALLFAASANLALLATLVMPDDVPRVWRGLAIGIACGTYLGAQIRFAQTLRELNRQVQDAVRDAALRAISEHLVRGDADAAWEAAGPIRDLADDDLLAAYRLAQVLTIRGDARAARRYWKQLERLDHHHIYRKQIRENLAALEKARSSAAEGSAAEP